MTDRTVLVGDLGQALTGVRIGDTVQERCVPAPGGGFAAVRIEVILPARPSAALGET